MDRFDVIVVGGGIAGLATAWHLARARGPRVCLLEREVLLASHASGRNAAIFRHMDEDGTGLALALRSREILAAIDVTGRGLIRATGTVFLASPARLGSMEAAAGRSGLAVQALGWDALRAMVPTIAGGDARQGLLARDDGVLDVSAICNAMAVDIRTAGAEIRVGTEVEAVLARGGRVDGVRLVGGGEIEAGAVTIAAGAWASGLGATCDAAIPITPMRRHLFLLAPPEAAQIQAGSPCVWRVTDDEVYFRPEPGGVLASPCDEEEWPPGVPPCSPALQGRLADRLSRLAPTLAASGVIRTWACLRSFAADRGLVAGEDPRVGGLYWIAGLGGRGMSCGLALGEVTANLILGQDHPLAAALAPRRLLVV